MASLRVTPFEIISLVCENLSRPDLRRVRLVDRDFNNAAQRVLFRTVFVKVRLPSFERLRSIAEHTTLRRYVQLIIYDGRELKWPEPNTFEGWLRHDAANGLGLHGREEFLARFSDGQLRNYYSGFCQYMQFIQGPVLQGDSDAKWLREAARKLPRLSAVEYAETELGFERGRELEPISSFSPLAQQILGEPEIGWGSWDKHFWMLVKAMRLRNKLLCL